MIEERNDNNPQNDALQKQILALKKEIEDKEWASKKTNEGIKILYKELEKKNEELKKLDQLKSDFISTVSHELRTPLTTIREAVSLLLDEIVGPVSNEQKEMLSVCLQDIDRLRRIIDNLLDISKIEAGKIQIKREWANLADLVKGVSASFARRAQNKGLQLKTTFSQEEIGVYFDRDKIIQIFNNLVGNAFKFTEQGVIEISVVEKDNCVECSVSDTGRGIAEEDLPKVFGKFQQFGRTPGPGEKGTGLGLAISKGIIELHKGDIWVESQLQKGTKFSFTLPKYTAQEFLKEHIDEELREAREKEESLSIVNLGIDDFDAIENNIGSEALGNIFQKFENLVKAHLSRKEDFVTRDAQSIFMVLHAANKEDIQKVKMRCQNVSDEFFSLQGLYNEVKVICKTASFPEDGNSYEELISNFKDTNASD